MPIGERCRSRFTKRRARAFLTLIEPANQAVLGEASGSNLGSTIMSQLDSIEAIVPHLRRFARALTGSQASGDAYVEATLQALVADPSPLTKGSVKVALYRVFITIWNSVSLNTDAGPEQLSPNLSVVDRRLAA